VVGGTAGDVPDRERLTGPGRTVQQQVGVVVGRIPFRHDRQDGGVSAEVTVEEVSDRDSRVLSTARDIEARKRLNVFANLETSSSMSRGYPLSRGRGPA
jgi:hypothetical protein